MADRLRVLLLIPRLNAGGAARVSMRVALGLAGRGHDVHLAAVTGKPGDASEAGVTLHGLGGSRVRRGAWPLIKLVRTLRPHVVLSNMAHLNLLVLALRPAFPARPRLLVRNDGGVHPEQLAWFLRWAFRWLHGTADGVICQSESMKTELAAELGSAARLHVLPNPVVIKRPAERRQNLWRGTGPNLLAIGRLVEQKGFDLLLEALTEIALQFAGANLAIVGDGPERGRLEALAMKLGIADRVRFPGEIEEPESWFAGATAFVSSSREDALPNALLEAAAAGLPIIATPARGGVPALLAGQPGTWIAKDISAPALAASIAEALSTFTRGQRFTHAWMEPFASDNSIAAYDDLIRSVARCAP